MSKLLWVGTFLVFAGCSKKDDKAGDPPPVQKPEPGSATNTTGSASEATGSAATGSAAAATPAGRSCADYVPQSVIDKHFAGEKVTQETSDDPTILTCMLTEKHSVLIKCLPEAPEKQIAELDAQKELYTRIKGGPGKAAWSMRSSVVIVPKKGDCQIMVSHDDTAKARAAIADIDAYVSK